MDEGSSDEKYRECGWGIVTAVRCYDGKFVLQEAGKKKKKQGLTECVRFYSVQ